MTLSRSLHLKREIEMHFSTLVVRTKALRGKYNEGVRDGNRNFKNFNKIN
jgi:hypothetical protein